MVPLDTTLAYTTLKIWPGCPTVAADADGAPTALADPTPSATPFATPSATPFAAPIFPREAADRADPADTPAAGWLTADRCAEPVADAPRTPPGLDAVTRAPSVAAPELAT